MSAVYFLSDLHLDHKLFVSIGRSLVLCMEQISYTPIELQELRNLLK